MSKTAVLVAIAIPVFTQQLERSREATDLSNIRAAYAEAMSDFLATGASESKTATGTLQQKTASWQMGSVSLMTRVNGSESAYTLPVATAGGTFTLVVDASGAVTVSFAAPANP